MARSPTGGEPYAALVLNFLPSMDVEFGSAVADRLLKSRAEYISIWGNDCELLHDLVDETEVGKQVHSGRSADAYVMTTWHADESLEDTIEFFLQSTNADDVAYTYFVMIFLGSNEDLEQQAIKGCWKALSESQAIDPAKDIEAE